MLRKKYSNKKKHYSTGIKINRLIQQNQNYIYFIIFRIIFNSSSKLRIIFKHMRSPDLQQEN